MRFFAALILLGAPVWGDAASLPRSQRVKTGLLAQDRASRETAARIARDWARSDPAGVEAIFDDLDLRGRAALLRALAGTGTSHGARIALAHAGDEEAVLFRAIVAGLQDGGRRAIFAEPPEGLTLGESRRRVLDDLRMRWKVEERFAALKSRSGRTGHFAGQYEALLELRPGAVEVMWRILRDRSWPLPGDASSEPYVALHPGMLDFDSDERRVLAAYSFGELVTRSDSVWQRRLWQLFYRYWALDKERFGFENEDLAPALAFSLHDLGLTGPARLYINRLRQEARHADFNGLQAMWDLGYAYMRIDKPVEGEKWYQRVIALQDDWGRGVAAYNLACHFAVRATREREPKRAAEFRTRALRWLQRAIEDHNFIDWVWMEEDGDLNSIRRQSEYVRLRAALKKRYPEPKRRKRIEKAPEKFLKPR